MQIEETSLESVKIIKPAVHGDDRGFFMECWNQAVFEKSGLSLNFVQDNHSRSSRGVLRGLHYQIQQAQGKLVRVTRGEVFDVAVDMRRSSAQFGQWFGTVLSESNKQQLWVPPGFAHGFYVLSEFADFQYKCTEYYAPEHERCLLWNDPQIGIEWPIKAGLSPQLAAKDVAGKRFDECESYR
ncbi:MAG: dTDP-4-dehydrorhamnose 3,5-epimerase [Granulosicoccus sp.]|nr:dTDP-4-dehydrorhamnose 3,5-epimerase [Granulosicoccus sp.]